MSDDNQQNLTPTQETALLALLSGSTVTQAAQSAGVSRDTVHRWLREDPAFQAEYNQLRNEMRDSAIQKLESLTDKAAAVVAAQIEAGDAVAAFSLLKGLGILSGKPPAGRPEAAKQIAAKMKYDALTRDLGI